MNRSAPSETIKLSFQWLLLTLVLMFSLGVVGGFIGQYMSRSVTNANQNLSGSQEKFVTNVQQVTVSPNKNTARVVETIERSLVLISQAQASAPAGIGIVATNDGLVVTTSNPSGDTFFGTDQTGQKVPLEKVGTDAVYGITYFRLKNVVTVPVDLSSDELSVGASLLLVGRSASTYEPQADSFMVGSYQYALEGTAPAIQRFMKNGLPASGSAMAGTPLVTDDGKVAGLLLNNSNEFALRISDVKESLERVIAQKREYDPFAVIGITPRYTFSEDATTGKRNFSLIVDAVTANSPATRAGIKAQDVIKKVNNVPVTWTENSVRQMSPSLPIQLTVVHQGQERSVSLTALP